MSFKTYTDEPISSTGNSKCDTLIQPRINKSAIDNSALGTSDDQKPQEMCIAGGCRNISVSHPEWDNEYCSINCCYNHCKTTFEAWLTANKLMKMKSNTVPITISSDTENQ